MSSLLFQQTFSRLIETITKLEKSNIALRAFVHEKY